MKDNVPLITTWKGQIALFITIGIIVFWFFSLADRAEFYFTPNLPDQMGQNLSGVRVLPNEAGRFPSQKLGSGVLASILLTLPAVSAASNLRKVCGWIVSTVSGIIAFWVFYFVLTHFDIWITAGGGLFSTTIEGFSYAVLSISLFVAIAPFMVPVVPKRIRGNVDDTTVDRYLRKQWKFAQGLLSIGLVGAIGGSIPALSGSADSVTYLGMVSLVGVLFTPFLVGALVFVYRTHRIEVRRRF